MKVATIGFFDGVHLGHQHLIRQVVAEAHRRGATSAVVTFGSHPRTVITTTPMPLLTTPAEKQSLLLSCGIDEIINLDFTPQLSQMSAHDFMQQILRHQHAVDTLIIGYDHRFGHNRSETFDDYVRYGQSLSIDVIRAEAFTLDGQAVSSSRIRHLLQDDGDIATANRLLGHPYTLSGTVVEGYRRGHIIGFPTANLRADESKLLPHDGVYSIEADTPYGAFDGMLNIGLNPTYNNTDRTVEAHLFDFNHQLYGQHISLRLYHHIRNEQPFSSPDELTEQLGRDRDTITRLMAQRRNAI